MTKYFKQEDGEEMREITFGQAMEGISSLPKVTDTPPMPKVKDPKPDIPIGTIRIGDIGDPLPRKEVISLQPGDVVVLINPNNISAEQRAFAEADLKKFFPDNESLFLSDGVTLEVYREQRKGPVGVVNISGKKEWVCGNCDVCIVSGDINKCPKIKREQGKPTSLCESDCGECGFTDCVSRRYAYGEQGRDNG